MHLIMHSIACDHILFDDAGANVHHSFLVTRISRSNFAQSGSPDPDQSGDLAIPLEHFVID
jgi:hypothetical protein